MKVHCLFEQSGTFKNEFKKLGIEAYDYDILNDFNQTDFQIDLFKEINSAYGGISIFDKISKEDLIFAFFPCIRFEEQILLHFRGDAYQQRNKTPLEKLEKNLILHDELSNLYNLITKLCIICLKRGLKLIIENPYSKNHYLYKYWSLKPSVIDMDRSKRGDYYKKPTQYYFINLQPKNNLIFEPVNNNKLNTTISKITSGCGIAKNKKVARSMIHPEYANRFIREYIL